MPQTGGDMESQTEAPKPNSRLFSRFLDGVEWMGNLLPHPVTLFALLAVGVVFLSGLLGALGLSVEDPRPPGTSGRAADGLISVVSLLNGEGLRRILQGLVPNFAGFVPLGTVLVAMLGVGVAEHSGLLSAAIRAMVLRAPPKLVTAAVVFAGILSNTASEMGYVVMIPLAAAIFLGFRNSLCAAPARISGQDCR